jgi:DNA polymerase-4
LRPGLPGQAFGIKTGTLVYEARPALPEVVLVPAHHKLYSNTITGFWRPSTRHIPVEDVMSIDDGGRVPPRRVQQAPAVCAQAARTSSMKFSQVGECPVTSSIASIQQALGEDGSTCRS